MSTSTEGAGVNGEGGAGVRPTAPPTTPPPLPSRLVIFDGVCHLCDGTVKFIIQRDPDARFKFCALQSEVAKPILRWFGISDAQALQSITYVEDGVAYTKSAAALMIAASLPVPYSTLASVGWCVPRVLRDACYDLVAANRYTVFGKSEACIRPTKEIRSRFIDVPTKAAATTSPTATPTLVHRVTAASTPTSASSASTHASAPGCDVAEDKKTA